MFANDIKKFNDMYGLPNGDVPSLTAVGSPVARMLQFGKIMRDEVDEGLDIIAALNKVPDNDAVQELAKLLPDATPEELAMVMLMDWLGDIQVYAASEMRRWGIPMEAVLAVIMQSNFSKLGEDGKAIMKDGKVQKGPNYWKPEPKLLQLLRDYKNAPGYNV